MVPTMWRDFGPYTGELRGRTCRCIGGVSPHITTLSDFAVTMIIGCAKTARAFRDTTFCQKLQLLVVPQRGTWEAPLLLVWNDNKVHAAIRRPSGAVHLIFTIIYNPTSSWANTRRSRYTAEAMGPGWCLRIRKCQTRQTL